MTKRKLTCEVCLSKESKYTCPKCELRSCSLDCYQLHILKMECDGKFDFVKIDKRSDVDILKLKSDFSFLENIDRQIDNLEVDLSSNHSALEKRFAILLKSALSNGINMSFMPKEMSRHKINQSYYNMKENRFLWTIELVYEGKNLFVHSVDASKTFGDIWGNNIKSAVEDSQNEAFLNLVNCKRPLQFFIQNRHKCAEIKASAAADELDQLSDNEEKKRKKPRKEKKQSISKELFRPLELSEVQIFYQEIFQNVLSGLHLIEFPTLRVLMHK